MAGISGPRGRTLEARSGGKIVRARRAAGSSTPYERPRSDDSEPANPNWISKLILSPTRAIATGTGKLISAVFSQDDSDSDSDSDSSSESDSGSEDNVENDRDRDYFLPQRADLLQERNSNLAMVKNFRKDPESKTGKRDKVCALEELLTQETFTREECNKLVKIIESRVVDDKDVDSERTKASKEKSTEKEDQEFRCTAVMEARKWLSEKKLKSASKSDPDNVIEDEVGSPVDMAKLYMRTRPLWASPTLKHGEFKSPSPIGTRLFNEETPYSISGFPLSSSKLKRDTPTTGSWNIQEEIQRVRAKATEEMLSSLPSKKIDWSSFDFEKRATKNPLVTERIYTSVNEADKCEPLNASLQTVTGKCCSHGLNGLETTPAGLQNEALLPVEVNIISEQNQDSQVIPFPDGAGPTNGLEDMVCEEPRLIKNDLLSEAGINSVHDCKETIASEKQPSSLVEGSLRVPVMRSHDNDCSTSKEGAGKESKHTNNGLLPLENSFSVEAALGPEIVVVDDEDHNSVSSSSNKIVSDAAFEDETRELLNEASSGIPNSPKLAVVNNQSLPRYSTRKGSKRGQVGGTVKKLGKRPSRYSRTKQDISTQ